MNPEQIAQLPTEDLDALIATLAKARAERPKMIPVKPPDAVTDLQWPAWWTNYGTGDGSTLLRLRHPGFGWLDFAFSPPQRAHLAGLWTYHSLMFPIVIEEAKKARESGQAPPAMPAGSGGTVH